jgi:hypothetical protein
VTAKGLSQRVNLERSKMSCMPLSVEYLRQKKRDIVRWYHSGFSDFEMKERRDIRVGKMGTTADHAHDSQLHSIRQLLLPVTIISILIIQSFPRPLLISHSLPSSATADYYDLLGVHVSYLSLRDRLPQGYKSIP